MKKFKSVLFMLVMTFLAISFVACTGNNGGGNRINTPNEELTGESKVLITYFSWSSSNNTKIMAEHIQEYTGGEIFRIQPKTPYTADYNEVLDIAQSEKSSDARPELFENITQEQLDSYDVVFVGYPVWWYDAPMIIYSFLEANDYSDKTVITFATSGGSGISDSNLRKTIDAKFISGLCISNISSSGSKTRIENWITELGLIK